MIFGMSIATFTALRAITSIVAIVCGMVVLAAMVGGRAPAGWTALFLATTVLTSATGFLFPSTGFTPAQAVGALSLVLLAIALFGFYGRHVSGAWRWVYVLAAVAALYLNCFVAVAQSFQKVPFLRALAPTQSEPPFQVAQLVVLAIFIAAPIVAVRRFHPDRRPGIVLETSTP